MVRMHHDLQRHAPQRRAVQCAWNVEIVQDGNIEHAHFQPVDETLVVAFPPPHLDARIRCGKGAEQRRNQERRYGDEAADIQAPGIGGGAVASHLDLASIRQHITGADCETAPCLGEHEASGVAAHEKLSLHHGLDLSDRHRNGRRGDMQRMRGLANALVVGRCEKVAELPQRELGDAIHALEAGSGRGRQIFNIRHDDRPVRVSAKSAISDAQLSIGSQTPWCRAHSRARS